MDAANSYHRHIHGVADVQQGLPGHLAHVRLGVGGKYRAYAKVVRAVRHSVQRFLHRVGRNADHHTLAHALAHLCGGHIVLPHMDALGVALQGHLHVIVDEQRHTVLLAQGVDLDGLLQKIGVTQLLFPQLHTGGTALQGTFHLLIQSLLAHPCAVGHRVQEHGVFIALHSLRLSPAVRGSCCKWHQ